MMCDFLYYNRLLVIVKTARGIHADLDTGISESPSWMISDSRMQREKAAAQAALYHLARAALQGYLHLPDSQKYLLHPVRHIAPVLPVNRLGCSDSM